jgi:hypothetical protein
MRLIFRNRGAEPIINKKYKQQDVFKTEPKSLKVKFEWDESMARLLRRRRRRA